MQSKNYEKCTWLSAHISFDGHVYSKRCDETIVRFVAPFIGSCLQNGWISKYFFIRYVEHSPHVRLRLYGSNDILEKQVKPDLLSKINQINSDLHIGLTTLSRGRNKKTKNKKTYHVSWIPYEPEIERYGGSEGVLLAELFFQYSSEICIALLQRNASFEKSVRLGQALILMIILIYVFLPVKEKVSGFVRYYGANYLIGVAKDEHIRSQFLGAFGTGYERQAEVLMASVERIWQMLTSSKLEDEIFNNYYEYVLAVKHKFKALFDEGRLAQYSQVLKEWNQAVVAILSSYLHMTNNRLGISIAEESYLAYLIYRAFKPAMDEELFYNITNKFLHKNANFF